MPNLAAFASPWCIEITGQELECVCVCVCMRVSRERIGRVQRHTRDGVGRYRRDSEGAMVMPVSVCKVG